VNDGGRIMLRASNQINHSGSITADAASTSAGKGGTVTLIADLANLSSRTEVNGSISAKGGNAGGDGGFIETSASKVRFGDNMAISTLAAPGLGGRNGTWLIDPTDFTISSGSGASTTSSIGATTLSTSLASSNVSIATDNNSGSDSGNIYVNSAVSWTAATTLSLSAYKDIYINDTITSTNTSGKLILLYGQGSDSGSISVVNDRSTEGRDSVRRVLYDLTGRTIEQSKSICSSTSGTNYVTRTSTRSSSCSSCSSRSL
jgi:hypothetical protein